MKLPPSLCRRLASWHRRICDSRPPDFVIGFSDAPYLKRWYLIPRNRWVGIYLHEILRDDEDRALHDHKMINLSVVVEGGYYEIEPLDRKSYGDDLARGGAHLEGKVWRPPGTVRLRLPSWPHRIVLDKETVRQFAAHKVVTKPARSIFLMGPYVREWGFWCKHGWRKWQDFVNMENIGEVGPGCD